MLHADKHEWEMRPDDKNFKTSIMPAGNDETYPVNILAQVEYAVTA